MLVHLFQFVFFLQAINIKVHFIDKRHHVSEYFKFHLIVHLQDFGSYYAKKMLTPKTKNVGICMYFISFRRSDNYQMLHFRLSLQTGQTHIPQVLTNLCI